MSEEESRYIANPDVEKAYAVTVEQVVVEMIQETGVEDGTQAEVMQRMKEAGWNIVRNVVKPYTQEFIILEKDGEIRQLGYVFVEGEEVMHVNISKKEWDKMAKGLRK